MRDKNADDRLTYVSVVHQLVRYSVQASCLSSPNCLTISYETQVGCMACFYLAPFQYNTLHLCGTRLTQPAQEMMEELK